MNAFVSIVVTIQEDFNTTEGQAISPIPPLLAFAIAMGYPAQVTLNENPVPFEYVSGMIRIPGHVQGQIKIEINFP